VNYSAKQIETIARTLGAVFLERMAHAIKAENDAELAAYLAGRAANRSEGHKLRAQETHNTMRVKRRRFKAVCHEIAGELRHARGR
jgi:hypothetical protein